MTIITISRQYGSGGDEIANRVCEILGYKQFDKRLIGQAATDVGLSEQEVLDYSEENHKVRTFLDRLLNRSQPIAQTRVWREDATGQRTVEEFELNEATAVALVQKAIRSTAKVDNMVIMGRGGMLILADEPDVLHIRIEAPAEDRIQRVKEQMKQSKHSFYADVDVRREAQDLIRERDAASSDYIKRFYSADWEDSGLYHLVINTGKLSLEQAAQIIVGMVRGFGILDETNLPSTETA